MNRKLILIPVGVLVALGIPAAASAHTPNVQPSCSGLTATGSAFEGPESNNTVTVTVDGLSHTYPFAGSFDHSVSWSQTVPHTWSVVIDANRQTGDPTQYDKTFTGAQQPCQQATSTSAATTTSPAPSSSTSTSTASPSTTTSPPLPTTASSTTTGPSTTAITTPAAATTAPQSTTIVPPETTGTSGPAPSSPASTDTTPTSASAGPTPTTSGAIFATGSPPVPGKLPATCFRAANCAEEGLQVPQFGVGAAAQLAIAAAVVVLGTALVIGTTRRTRTGVRR